MKNIQLALLPLALPARTATRTVARIAAPIATRTGAQTTARTATQTAARTATQTAARTATQTAARSATRTAALAALCALAATALIIITASPAACDNTAPSSSSRAHLTASPAACDWKPLYESADKCREMRDYRAAEMMYRAALKEAEEKHSPESDLTPILDGLGKAYLNEKKYPEAQTALERSISIYEKSGKETMDFAHSLCCLAVVYARENRLSDAEPLFERNLSICRRFLTPDDGYYMLSLRNCGHNCCELGRFKQAEDYFQEALASVEKRGFPKNGLELGEALNDMGNLYADSANYKAAEEYFKRALYVKEAVFYPSHGEVWITFEHYLAMLEKAGRNTEARRLKQRMDKISKSQRTTAGGIDREGKDVSKYCPGDDLPAVPCSRDKIKKEGTPAVDSGQSAPRKM